MDHAILPMRKLICTQALDPSAVDRALEQLKAVVRDKGLRRSSAREAVARAALEYEGHFTAEELHSAMRAQGTADVHFTTVYRVLPLLVEAKLIQMSLVSTGHSHRYERAFERGHHDHIICTSCEMVVEFEPEAFEVIQRDIMDLFGFSLTGRIHELFGICRNCQRQP